MTTTGVLLSGGFDGRAAGSHGSGCTGSRF